MHILSIVDPLITRLKLVNHDLSRNAKTLTQTTMHIIILNVIIFAQMVKPRIFTRIPFDLSVWGIKNL